MKLSSILFGGLLGAAATLYVARKRPGATAWAASALSEACSAVGKKSLSMIVNQKLKAYSSQSSQSKHKTSSNHSPANWSQIESLINQDSELKAQASKIMAESSTHTH